MSGSLCAGGFAPGSQPLIPLESPGLSKGADYAVFMACLLICVIPAASAEICSLGFFRVGAFMDSLQIKINLLVQSTLF